MEQAQCPCTLYVLAACTSFTRLKVLANCESMESRLTLPESDIDKRLEIDGTGVCDVGQTPLIATVLLYLHLVVY